MEKEWSPILEDDSKKDELDPFESFTPDEKEARAVEMASMYDRFIPISEVNEKMKEVLRNGEHRPEFVEEMETVLQNMEGAVEILKLSLKNQEEYNLVDKRWMRSPDFMREALGKGRFAMELDVRMDKDGIFWVSHATGARASFTPPFIHEMTTEEMEEKGNRFKIEEAFQIFSEYKQNGHKLILELKTLGPDEEKFSEVIENLKKLVDIYGLEDSVAISSLSPGILMSVHKELPEIPLILNGGIVPGVSYEKPEEEQGFIEKIVGKIRKPLVSGDKKWRAFGVSLPWIGKPTELVFSDSEDSVVRPDGEGTQTGYALTRLPNDLTQVLKEQNEKGQEYGGMVSLSAVTIFAGILEMVGASEKAKEMRKYYTEVVDKLGLGKMATTWGQGLGKIPFLGNTLFFKLKPEEQIKVFKEQLGIDTMIYTKAPEEFAHELPDFTETYK